MKNKILLFGIIFILSVNISFTQEYLTMRGSDILVMLDTSDKFLDYEHTQNHIKANYTGSDKFNAYYHLTKFNGCDSIYIEYYCNDCVKSHLEDIFAMKREKWVEIDNGLFISNRRTSVYLGFSKSRLCRVKYMKIEKTPDEEICTRINFWLEEVTQEDWKKQVKNKKRRK